MDVEGNGLGVIKGTVVVFVSRDWGKQRQTSVRIVGIPAEIRTKHLQNEVRNVTGRATLFDANGIVSGVTEHSTSAVCW
jgi:hypothetical protein